MVTKIRITEEQRRAAQIEVRAFEAAGRMPDPVVWLMAHARPMYSDEFDLDATPEDAGKPDPQVARPGPAVNSGPERATPGPPSSRPGQGRPHGASPARDLTVKPSSIQLHRPGR